MYRQRAVRLAHDRELAGSYLSPAAWIVFTITVPFGYFEPTFRLLA